MRDWLVNLPEELTESDLIDMVEGTLSPTREAIAIAALKAEPRLGLLIKQMRMDKAAMAGAAPEPAPADLGDRVLATIDNQMMREVAASEQEISSSIPISTFQYDESSNARAVLESPVFRTFAVAAAVLLIAGVTAYVVRETRIQRERETQVAANISRAAKPASDEPTPGNTPDGAAGEQVAVVMQSKTEAEMTPPPSPAPLPQKGPEAGTAIAEATKPDTHPAATIQEGAAALKVEIIAKKSDSETKPAESTAPGNASPAAAPTTTIAAAPATTAPSPEKPAAAEKAGEPMMSVTAAARLARDGRLALVLRPKDAPALLKRLDGLARAAAQSPSSSQRELAWRALDIHQVPAQFAALTVPSRDDDFRPPALPTPTPPTAPTIASSDPAAGQKPAVVADHAIEAPLPTSRLAVKAIYTVEIEPTERGLAELTRVVGEVDGQTVRYRVLQAPVARELSLDPETVLWWTSGPVRWSKPALVPLVIEVRE